MAFRKPGSGIQHRAFREWQERYYSREGDSRGPWVIMDDVILKFRLPFRIAEWLEGKIDKIVPQERPSMKNRPVNPWAVCTASVGRKDRAKYERCVRAVKARMGMKNPSISAVWPAMKDRQRFAALQFAGVPEERAKYHAILSWSDLPVESKSALLKGWHMGEVGRTTRRYRDTTRRMPVLTNPTDGWAVTQEGETLKQFGPGTKGANAAFAWLHKRQGNSVDWAVQYSGYDMVNVEGGKVVYSYKRQGLRRLTNPGSPRGMEDRAREVIRKAESALGSLNFGAKVNLLLDNLPFRDSKEATALLLKLGYRKNGTKGAYPFKEKAEHYRARTIAELLYARRDAAQAARAMKGHDPAAENWYMDDFFTISDEITRRRQSLPNKGKGMRKSLKNAAAGATKVVEAFLAGRKAREGSRPDYKAGARYETDGTNLIQWGSIIARKVNGSIEITDAGWRTKTTMAMLNAVLYRAAMNVSLYQKSHQWFLSTSDGVKPWNGKAVIKLDGGSVLANRKGRAAKMRTRQRRAAQRKGRWYVSTYEVTQSYGGPEEGGWWYSRGFPTGQYRQFRTREEANSYAMKLEMGRKERTHQLQQKLKAEGYRGWSQAGEDDLKIIVQDHPPRRFPEYRPHYENNPKRTHKNPEKGGWVLQSANWIYAPGFLKWIMHGYATSRGKQKEKFANFVRITWGDIIPKAVSRGLAAGTIPYKIVGENVHVDKPGKGVRLNPLSRAEAARALRWAKGEIGEGYRTFKDGLVKIPAYSFGRARGVAGVVRVMGPKAATAVARKMGERAERGFAAMKGVASLSNPISCLKNLHTARERAYAKKLIVRYWQSGKAAIASGSRDRAAHAYGALAAIRRLAQFELPHAKVVSTLASLRMEMLRRSARDFARMRKGGR